MDEAGAAGAAGAARESAPAVSAGVMEEAGAAGAAGAARESVPAMPAGAMEEAGAAGAAGAARESFEVAILVPPSTQFNDPLSLLDMSECHPRNWDPDGDC
eukprot:7682014-Karenia_brevis.AAC.1